MCYSSKPLVKILFDTNVLIAALVAVHARHEQVWPWFEQIIGGTASGYFSLHTIAESYNVLDQPSY